MDLNLILSLCLATAIVGISPGPAVFATIAYTFALKLKKTYCFILGIILGDLFFALSAMLGLALIASKFTFLFLILKIIGGGYLIYLGYKSWISSKSAQMEKPPEEANWKIVSNGFFLTASNPKDLLFFIGFLPAFIDLENSSLSDFIIASVAITITFFITLSIFALSAHKARRLFESEKSMIKLNRISAIMLVCVGLFVIVT